MLLNAYETAVGKPFSVTENIKGSVKTLALMDDLVKSPKEGVYFIDHENGGRLPLFTFPLSVQSHDRKFITVLDRRSFFNKKGVILNAPEYSQALVTACVQQDVQENNLTVLKACRYLAARGYARALGNRLARASGLDEREQVELTVFLAHFYTCLMERSTDDVAYISQNVIRQSLFLDRSITHPLIEEMGYVNTIDGLVAFLSERDAFYKLRSLTKKDFIGLGSTIWFSNLGRHIMGAALEHPPTFTGICYATVNNTMYQKTTLGGQLDRKYNERLVESFSRMINTTYPLSSN